MKYYKLCRVRCLCCGDILERINRTKTGDCFCMLWCNCGRVGLDPAAAGYWILGDTTDYKDLSEEWGGKVMQYKVVCKIEVRGEDAANRENMCQRLGTETEFVAYKIIAGLYIFYITQEVYEQGVQAGWIQPMVEEVPVFFFDTMLRIRGTVCYHRMKTALKLSTPEYLRECLERIERSPKTVRIRIHQVQWHGEEPVLSPLSEVYLNVVAGNIFGKQSFHENAGFDPLFHVESYEGLLDVLADLLDREYMNSRDLYEQFAGNNFYDIDKIWFERKYKVDFEFIEGEQNAVT